MNNEAWLQSVRWHIVQNQSSRQLQAHKQQPSASARTEREAIVSEDNIIFVNDLLPPRVGAISTYSAPAATFSHPHKKPPIHVCEDKNATPCSCSSYSQTRIMDCFFLPCCRYGFGLLDAGLMVQQAAHFHSVSSQKKCTQEVTLDPAR